jgi:isochorismate synthase
MRPRRHREAGAVRSRPPHTAVRHADPGHLLAHSAARLEDATTAAAKDARRSGRPLLVWTTVRIPRVEPIALFERAGLAVGERMLWECPGQRFGLVGLGSAWAVTATGSDRFQEAGAAWRSLVDGAFGDDPARDHWGGGPVAMGGFAFEPEGPTTPEWQGYPAGRLVLPRLSVATTGDASWITLAAMAAPNGPPLGDAEEEISACVDACAAALGRGAPRTGGELVTPALRVDEVPSAEAWKGVVGAAAAAIREGWLKKVVLARAIRVGASRLDPVRALRRLRADYSGCTLFAVARGDRCFLGATPERLVRIHKGEVSVAAVAGSAPRGATVGEDRRFGEALLANLKDRAEHAIVVDALRDVLARICTTVSVEADPVVLKVRSVQHLSTPLTGVLRERRTALDLVDLLHPTPAVGGAPRDEALRWIREHEGLDRGWYAGPVGWMDRTGDGEFAVAIRSALLRATQALVFAGCGIMPSSDPDQEYAESWLKLQPILSALNGT